MEVLTVVLASAFSAVTLFLIAKVIGHKQMAQLDFFDYVTGITIGSIAAELATTLDSPWWKPFVSMMVYGAIAVLLSWLTAKFPKTRKYINGTPTIVLDNGKLYRQNMKKAKLELSEFMVLCRQQGYFNLQDIQTAVFEYNGTLAILPVSAKRPVQPADMALSPPPESICTEVIMDGRVLDENLKRMGLDAGWLKKKLTEQGYKHAQEVFLGVCDSNQTLLLYKGE